MAKHANGPGYSNKPKVAPKPAVHAPNQPSAPLAYAPAPPPPTAIAPQPFDPALEAQRLSAGRNVALGNNEATWQTQNAGYNLGYNPDGTANAANPYSQAQLYADSYKRSKLGTRNSMFAAGQGYSGALLNAQAENDRSYSQSDAALRQRALQQYHSIQSGKLANYASNASDVSDADWNSVLKSTYG
jgi:hypothetical protein